MNYRLLGIKLRFGLCLAACLGAVTLGLSGCDFSQTTYGGSGEYLTLEILGPRLMASSSLVMRTGTSNATGTSNVTNIANQITTFQETTAPVDFVPDTSNLASVNSGFLHFAPGGGGTFFSTPTSKQLLFPSATIFVVMKATSVGELLSINPQDRVRQALELSSDGTQTTAKFYSSVSAFSQSSLATPAGTVIVGATFYSDSSAIDLSVNGHLAPRATVTGTLNPVFEIGRIISAGPSVGGNSTDVKEILVFNRALSRSEHGAILKFLSTENSLPITLDASLSTVGGALPPDPNFGSVQSMIESKCVQCHGAWSGAGANFYVSQGLITKGDALNSKLYYRLQGSLGSGGPKTMPQNGSISAGEVDLVKTWITNAP